MRAAVFSLLDRSYPLLSTSSCGMLTADEFVRAGDALVASNPSWAWEGGDPTRQRAYLPCSK
jgi:hypothetical protein